MTTYRNPWHKPHDNTYGPEFYHTMAKPSEHRGFLVYHRLLSCWDVVKDGVCLTQRAGPNGARSAIDCFLDCPEDYFSQRMASYLPERLQP